MTLSLRNVIFSGILLLTAFAVRAQAPQQMNYQAVVRDASGQPLAAGTTVSLRLQIHNASPSGAIVYTETESVVTNQFGLINYAIGYNGNLASVNWSNGAKYLQVSIDETGGSNFTDMGTSQLLSVPYALYSGNSASGNGPTGAQGPAGQQGLPGADGDTGPTGAQGVAGVPGSTGAQGVRGATGIQGLAGANGVTGAQGITGSQGLPGMQGATGNNGVQGIQGFTGAVGAQGIQGVTGNVGAQGVTGVMGLQGVAGAVGAQGPQGVTGIDGVQGIQGVTGNDGVQGIQGVTGTVGSQGIQGATGIDGTQGTQGVTGTVGAQGIQGVTGNDGAQGMQGVTGNDGAQGIQGSTGIDGVQGIQGVTGAVGTQGMQGATGIDGAQGIQGVTGAVGVQGIQGVTGNDGVQGIEGASGIDGAQGIQGVTGAVGAQGNQGATGNDGAQGIPGVTGAVGSQGIQGATGNNGVQGITGNDGAQGIQGVTGNDGVQGIQGATGAVGSQGIQGVTGIDGVQGIQGVTGNDGSQGIQGVTGAVGAQGMQGITGNNGVQGIQGVTGAVGAQGIQGVTGNDGAQGMPGVTGAVGAQGIQGATGAQGLAGATGLLPDGSVLGNTTYWNGSQWVTNSSAIYNNGTNIGIGTTNPTHTLDVSGGQVVLDLQDNYGGLHVKGYNGGEASMSLQPDNVNDGAAGQWILYTNGPQLNNSQDFGIINSGTATPPLIIQASNNYIGINTVTPFSQLDVNGSLTVTSNVSNADIQLNSALSSNIYPFGPNVPADQPLQLRSAGMGILFLNNDNAGNVSMVNGGGNVGIGAVLPSAKLDVEGNVKINDGTAQGGYVFTSADAIGTGSWQPIPFQGGYWSANGNNIYNNNTGSLGIGTSSPTAQLDVAGTVRFENYTGGILAVDPIGDLVVRNGSGIFTAGTGLSWAGTTLNSVWTVSGNNIYNNNTAKVGIGTATPLHTLDVAGTFNVSNTATGITPAAGDSSTQFATTAFVKKTVDNAAPNYVANGTAQQTNSNFNIDGNGVVGGGLSAGVVITGALDAASANVGGQTTTGSLLVTGAANGVTPVAGDSSTQLATTAFIDNAIDNSVANTSGNYVANGTSQQANSNFNVSGNGTIGGTLNVPNANVSTTLNAGAVNVANNLNAGSANVGGNLNAGTENVGGLVRAGSLQVNGTATGITPSAGDSSTQFATTAFIDKAIDNSVANTSGNYVANGTTPQTGANFNIDGTGTVGQLQIGASGGIISTPANYGSIALTQDLGSYYGILFGPVAGNAPNLMFDQSGDGGYFIPNTNQWESFYTSSSQHFTFGGAGDLGATMAVLGTGYYSGRLGLNTQSPTAQLDVNGTVRVENYTNGLLSVDGNGNLGVATGSGLFTAGHGLSWAGTTLNSNWTTSGNNVYNNNSGSVGINTASPVQTLSVNGNAGIFNSNAVQFYTDGGSTLHGFVGEFTAGSDMTLAAVTNGNWLRIGSNQAPIAFFTDGTVESGTPKILINTNGNLGVGTISPTAELDVKGTVRFDNLNNGLLSVDGSGNLGVATGSGLFTAGTGLTWSGTTLNSPWTVSGTNIYNNNASGVGIGTTTVTHTMDVAGGQVYMDLQDSYGGLHVEGKSGGEASIALNPDNVANGNAGQWILYTNGSQLNNPNDFAIFNSGTGGPNMVIQASSGNVGIGTVTPAARLDVEGNVKIADGTQAAGSVLTSDANGLASWKPSPSAIHSLNGSTDTVQTFATGNTGTDFNISTSGGTHTFNLPDASTTARGAVTTGTQTIAGNKTFTGNTASTGTMVVGANTVGTGAAMEVVSTTGAFLPPVMTTTQRDAISGTRPGATIFNTTNNELEYYVTGGTYNTGNTSGTSFGYVGNVWGQTFQSAPTSTLNQITISIYDVNSVGTATYSMSIYDALGGALMATASNTFSTTSGGYTGGAYTFNNDNLTLVAGHTYYFQVTSSDNSNFIIYATYANQYPQGDLYVNGTLKTNADATFYLQTSVATGWVSANAASGLQGLQGATGAVGAQGPTGAQGIQGATGAIGATGAVGAAGATGAMGATGLAGATGLLSSGSAAGNTPYWNGSAWVTNSSNIYNDGGNVGIGTVAPSAQLHTTGTVRFQNYPSGILGTDANGNLKTDTVKGTTSQIDVTNGNGVSGNPTLAIDATYTEAVKAGFALTGGGTVTLDNSSELSWSNRFMVMNDGGGSQFSTSGYFELDLPSSGSVITGVNGVGNTTVTAGGIPIGGWQALYYILPIGSGNTSLPANYRISGFGGTYTIPENWVLVAIENGDDGSVKLANGTILQTGQSWSANAGNTSYIHNTTSQQTGSNFNISGNGTIGSTLQVGGSGTVISTPDSWGTIGLTTAQGGYYGVAFGSSSTSPNWMWDANGNGGMYYPANGSWDIYYNHTNKHFSVGYSGDEGYGLAANGSGYFNGGLTAAAGDLNISGNATVSGGTLNLGGATVKSTIENWGTLSLTSNGGGFYGVSFGANASSPNMMFESAGDGGLYDPAGGGWITYYTNSNHHYSIGGSTDLGSTLNVNGTMAVSGALKFSNYANGLLQADGSGNITVNNTSLGLNIGGATPTQTLDVNGEGLFRNGNTGNPQLGFGYNGTANYQHDIRTRHNGGAQAGNAIDFYVWNEGVDAITAVGSKQVMTLDGTGNVGIGQSTPGAALDVNGSVKFESLTNGFLSVDGSGNLTVSSTSGSFIANGTSQQASSNFNISGNGTVGDSLTTAHLKVTAGAATGKVLTSDASGNATWQTASSGGSTHAIGDYYGGGVVFWVDPSGAHGLVCTVSDQSTNALWFAGTPQSSTTNSFALGSGTFTGAINTSVIISTNAVLFPNVATTYAARICNELSITVGSYVYGGWYLPSQYELQLMYNNMSTINTTATANGGSNFVLSNYWSSTEASSYNAQQLNFSNNIVSGNAKNSNYHVRAVRAF